MNFIPKLLITCAAVVLGATSGLAQTAPVVPNGPYFRLEGGWSTLNREDLNGNGFSGSLRSHDGFIAGVATGYKTGPYRLELNLDYSQEEGKRLHVNSDGGAGAALGGGSLNATNSNVSGTASNATFMVNGFYDIRTGTAFSPYVGLGIGGARFSLDDIKTTNRAVNVNLFNDSDIQFAFQPMLGLDYAITPQLSIGAQYRYFQSVDPNIKTTTGENLNLGNSSHNVLVSLTWHIGTPPAPMPPVAAAPVAATPPSAAPAPPPPHQLFLVFFDFAKDSLTPGGRKVVAAAAAAYKRDGSAKLQITGYTDLAGTQPYNLGLSRRRADVVRAALIADGVPADQISATWRGKENPRVPTADGVREPQNRRVEIVLP